MSIDLLHEKIRKLKCPLIIDFSVRQALLPEHLLLEENNLLAVADGMAYGIDKHGRKWPVHHLAALQVGYVYDVYLWQHHALVAFGQLHQTVLAVHGIIV